MKNQRRTALQLALTIVAVITLALVVMNASGLISLRPAASERNRYTLFELGDFGLTLDDIDWEDKVNKNPLVDSYIIRMPSTTYGTGLDDEDNGGTDEYDEDGRFQCDSNAPEDCFIGLAEYDKRVNPPVYRFNGAGFVKNAPTDGKKYILMLVNGDSAEVLASIEKSKNIIVEDWQTPRDLTKHTVILREVESIPATGVPEGRDIITGTQTYTEGRASKEGSENGDAGNQDEPTDSRNRENPSNPNEPNNPNNPADPNNPNDPGNPENPNDPNNPSDPNNPDDPDNPSTSTKEIDMQTIVGLITSDTIQTYLENITDKDSSTPGTDNLQSRISGTSGQIEEAEYMQSLLESFGFTVKKMHFKIGDNNRDTYNLIAHLDGDTHPEKRYVIISHMDSTNKAKTLNDKLGQPAPGADDNGSGTVTNLAIAKAFGEFAQQEGSILPYSLDVILFSGEEQGLVGSEIYTRALPRDHGILGVVNSDMVGYSGGDAPCVNAYYKSALGSNIFADTIAEVNQSMNIGLQMRSGTLGQGLEEHSDHAPFWTNARINSAVFTHHCKSISYPGYHHKQIPDNFENIDINQTTMTAQVIGASIMSFMHDGLGSQLTASLQSYRKNNAQKMIAEVDSRKSSTSTDDSNVLGTSTDDNPLLGGSGTEDDPYYLIEPTIEEDSRTLLFVQYTELSDLPNIYSLSKHPIDYFYSENTVADRIFTGLFTEKGIEQLRDQGIIFKTIDNAFDYERYVSVGGGGDETPNLLSDVGTAYKVSGDNYYVKLDEGKDLEDSANHAPFFHSSLPFDTTPPPFDTTRITPIPTDVPRTPTTPDSNTFELLTLTFALTFVLIGGILGIYLWKKHQDVD